MEGIHLSPCPNSAEHQPMLFVANTRYICVCPACCKHTIQAMRAGRFIGGYGTKEAAVDAWNNPDISIPA